MGHRRTCQTCGINLCCDSSLTPQPKRVRPCSTQSYTRSCVKQRVFYPFEIHWFCQLLLLENRTPNKVILTNRRMPNGSGRKCTSDKFNPEYKSSNTDSLEDNRRSYNWWHFAFQRQVQL